MNQKAALQVVLIVTVIAIVYSAYVSAVKQQSPQAQTRICQSSFNTALQRALSSGVTDLSDNRKSGLCRDIQGCTYLGDNLCAPFELGPELRGSVSIGGAPVAPALEQKSYFPSAGNNQPTSESNVVFSPALTPSQLLTLIYVGRVTREMRWFLPNEVLQAR